MDPKTTRSSLTPTMQTHFQLDRVIQAAIFSFHSRGICVSGVFSATGSCVNLRHALLLFAAARLMWWPREPCSDCLTRLSASWLWAKPSGDNVYQILLLSHMLRIHAAARRHAFQHKHTPTDRPLFTPDPDTLVIHWRFRMFSDGGGSLVNTELTCWQADVETSVFWRLHGANSSFN